MEGDKGIGATGSESSSRVASFSSSSGGARQRFNIELRPGETTIVSWKRLLKDANVSPAAVEPPLTMAGLTPESQVAMVEGFQDDKSTSKDDGFIVDSGRLECINETILSANHQSKKRPKNIIKSPGDRVDDHVPNKHAKLSYVATNAQLVEQSSSQLQKLAANNEGISTVDASVFPLISKDINKDRAGRTHRRDTGNNVTAGAVHQKYQEKISSKQLGSPIEKLIADANDVGNSTKVGQKEKKGHNELPDLNIPAYPLQPEKSPSMHSDVSDLRPKGTMLERAIRELEKVVAETRPRTMEVLDLDASSAAIKRRLPPEVKQKLAKVARLAQSSQGKISEELINRLMFMLGHLVHVRTLKKNLREMVLLGLSAKREKADRFQQLKREVMEMIKQQTSKLRDGTTDGFQAVGSEVKGVPKDHYMVDNAMEDKICDLYDLYIQGMDEDKGPQIRKLYVELAELWPNGIMDNNGIKSAIRRAKERRRALFDHQKIREKNRRKKLSAPKIEDRIQGEASSIAQSHAVQERLNSESSNHILATPFRAITGKETDQHVAAAVEISSPSLRSSNVNILEQDKLEKLTFAGLKEQMKQQHREVESRAKKLSLKSERESSHKSHKRAVGQPEAVSNHLAAPPSCERPG